MVCLPGYNAFEYSVWMVKLLARTSNCMHHGIMLSACLIMANIWLEVCHFLHDLMPANSLTLHSLLASSPGFIPASRLPSLQTPMAIPGSDCRRSDKLKPDRSHLALPAAHLWQKPVPSCGDWRPLGMLCSQPLGGMALHLNLLPGAHLCDQDFIVHRCCPIRQQICRHKVYEESLPLVSVAVCWQQV